MKAAAIGGGGGISGGVVDEKRDWKFIRVVLSVKGRVPFILMLTGRGGIGGGVEDVFSDEACAPLIYTNRFKIIELLGEFYL